MVIANTLTGSARIESSKSINRLAVLDLIRFSAVGISRAEIARQLNISRSAVTSLVNHFIDMDIVREMESGPTSAGRRPILLGINPKKGYVVGVDMGASHLALLVADLSSRVLDEVDIPFEVTRGPEVCLQEVNAQIAGLLATAGILPADVVAIGVGVPGPVIVDSGTVGSPPIMPGWDGYPIRSELEEYWSRPVSLNNDAELGALGEWAYGAGRGERHLVYIKVGTGVGAGLLIDGRIYQGASGCAGEIGHITIDGRGPLCSCGNQGCLESVASGRAIAQQASEAVRFGRRTRLAALASTQAISASDVAVAARLGDLVAQRIVAEAGHNLGTAIAAMVNLFNPSVVIVGGGVAQMGDLLLEPIRQTVGLRSLKSASRVMRITASVLGRRSSCMGAVAQALTLALHQIAE